MQKITDYFFWFLFGFGIATIFTHFALTAMDKEDQMRDSIRLERCTKMGENLPKKWGKYCEKGQ